MDYTIKDLEEELKDIKSKIQSLRSELTQIETRNIYRLEEKITWLKQNKKHEN